MTVNVYYYSNTQMVKAIFTNLNLMGREWSVPKLKMSKVVNTDANETFASTDPQDIKVYFY